MNMKKIILGACVAFIALFLTACGKNLDGTYNSYRNNGSSFAGSDATLMTLTIKGEDVDLVVEYYDVKIGFFSTNVEPKSEYFEGTLDKKKKTITFNGEALEYKLENDTLIIGDYEFVSEKDESAYQKNIRKFKAGG
ncbi:hypothetical protein [Streptococcus marmotae]|uniref:hypothetical protein n=1 Tax=Streptococcus marmotae TaxID=1825069 RepID=UPI000835A98D|nr:hypothetical protein [Streptococcus marmotae]